MGLCAMISSYFSAFIMAMQKPIFACLLLAVLGFGVSSSVVEAQTRASNVGGIDLAYRQRTEERLAAIDDQMRNLTGEIERLQFRLRQSDARVKKLSAAVAKLKQAQAEAARAPVDGGGAIGSQANTGGQIKTGAQLSARSQTLPTGAPQAQYDQAQGLLRVGRFKEAEAAFRNFRTMHPKHTLAANSHYWIGETQYARQRYQDAATTFLEAWQADIDGPKAADNLYKLGMSLAALEKKKEACVSFAKLLNDYRGAPKRLRTKAVRERASLGCA